MVKHLCALTIALLLGMYHSFAQEEIASAKMKLKEFESTVVFPQVDHNKNVHIFAISKSITDQNIIHIKYDSAIREMNLNTYQKPDDLSFKQAVGIAVDTENTISLYFHKKAKGKFNRVSIDENGTFKNHSFDLKIKKEKVVQYMSDNNQFMMLTVNRNQSILNLYKFNGNDPQKTSFDLNKERFYSKDSKIVPLSDVLYAGNVATITGELSNKAIQYGKSIKIYPSKNTITISLNNNKNGTRIISLDQQKGTAKADYAPIPTREFAEGVESSLRTNSFISENKIYSLIVSKKLLVIDIKDLESKKVLKVLKLDPNQGINFKSTKLLISPVGPASIETSKTKEKTKDAKAFFRSLKYATFSGLYVQSTRERILLKIGGYTPPSSSAGGGMLMSPGSVSASSDAFGNVSIASTPPMYFGGNPSFSTSSYGFDKYLLLNSENYGVLNEETYEDIYDKLDKYKKKSNRLVAFVKYGDFFLHGSYNKKEGTYKLVKILP
ncbi:hypothetical protein FGF1_15660 [Flavobacteriaceae bacterium GF1]